MSKKIVLDASALLALLQKENGFEQVEKRLPHAMMSSVNLSEVIAVLIHVGISEEKAYTLTTEIINEIIPFDSEQAYLAAYLRKLTKTHGLSLGDRACLALAQLQKTTVLTADKIWSKLQLNDIRIEVIR